MRIRQYLIVTWLIAVVLTISECGKKSVQPVVSEAPTSEGKEQPQEQKPEVEIVDVWYLDKTIQPSGIPSAMYSFLVRKGVPLVSFTLVNNSYNSINVIATCEIVGYTDQAEDMEQVPPGGTITIDQAPLFRPNVLEGLTEIKTANLHWEVSYLKGKDRIIIDTQTRPIRLWAKDTIAWYIQARGDTLPCFWTIAMWVTPHDPKIEELISKAKEYIYFNVVELNDYIIEPGYYLPCPIKAMAGAPIIGNINSDSDVNIYLVDAYNLQRFRNNQTFYYYTGAEHVKSFLIYHVPQVTEEVYLIIDNTFSWFTSKRVSADIKIYPRLLVGYHELPWGTREEVVIAQLRAIYDALQKEYRITYINSPISYPYGTQRVRLPRDALTFGSANCIDGTVLFASALENIGLNPLIVIVPGHAFLGVETWSNSGEGFFLETTMVGGASFEQAFNRGWEEYTEHASIGDMVILPIREARKEDLTPMAKIVP